MGRLAQVTAMLGGDVTQAKLIHAAMLDLLAQDRGRDIGHDTVWYARPRKKISAGPARDLRDLSRTARKAIAGDLSWQDWVTAWTRLPATTRRRVWQPPLIRAEGGRMVDRSQLLRYSAPGFAMIAPKPETVLPSITAALSKTPRSKRRKPDALAQAAVKTIWHAFLTIPGSSRSPRSPRFRAFGEAVDQIYDSNLFFAKEGRRFRRLR